ncbi:MAG: hypothetical protein JNK42_02260 [Caedimonas sp.]|nr:hypothetical protein [Caedimonas sp.]
MKRKKELFLLQKTGGGDFLTLKGLIFEIKKPERVVFERRKQDNRSKQG